MIDDDFDAHDAEPVDLDVDPQLAFGFRSPKDLSNKSAFTAHPVDLSWLEAARRDRAERKQRRAAAVEENRAETRRRVAERKMVAGRPQFLAAQPDLPPEKSAPRSFPTSPPDNPHEADHPVTPLPGQHGAHFTVRTYRPWYAPWWVRRVWVQTSAWQYGLPPEGATVVTVADVAQLPGKVTTLGTVYPSGAVEW